MNKTIEQMHNKILRLRLKGSLTINYDGKGGCTPDVKVHNKSAISLILDSERKQLTDEYKESNVCAEILSHQ